MYGKHSIETQRAGMWSVPRTWQEAEENQTVINVSAVQEMARVYHEPTYISIEGLHTDEASATGGCS